MTIRAIVALAAAAVILSAGAAAAAPDEAQIARGHLLVQHNCAMCHAIGPMGDSPNGLAPRFRELYKRYPIEDLGEALAEGIIVGHPEMPEFHFSGDEVSDIIAYLQSIQTHQHARLLSRSAAPG
jgi:mono/diheme cytochrome c family protein